MAGVPGPNPRYVDYPKDSPWKRGRDEVLIPPRKGLWIFQTNKNSEVFDDMKYANMDIDIHTKRAALRVSASVVGLVSYVDLINLSPGDTVIAVGRFRDFYLMVAPGVLSLDRCKLDCKELMMANCQITLNGIGGPLINLYGEVIGFNFYQEFFTPFLAVNIVSKCLDHFKRHGRFFRPWVGMEATNLYAARIDKLEHIIQNYPNIFKGVIVENVIPGSHAHHSGILEDDVIVSCDGIAISGFLEFFNNVWDKTGGGPLELLVIRKGSPGFLKINMVVEEASPDKHHIWPLPQVGRVSLRRFRRHK